MAQNGRDYINPFVDVNFGFHGCCNHCEMKSYEKLEPTLFMVSMSSSNQFSVWMRNRMNEFGLVLEGRLCIIAQICFGLLLDGQPLFCN